MQQVVALHMKGLMRYARAKDQTTTLQNKRKNHKKQAKKCKKSH
jgi:hypothetical protein